MNRVNIAVIVGIFVFGVAFGQEAILHAQSAETMRIAVAATDPTSDTTGIEHEDIGSAALDSSSEGSSGGNIETEFKVEEGESTIPDGDPDEPIITGVTGDGDKSTGIDDDEFGVTSSDSDEASMDKASPMLQEPSVGGVRKESGEKGGTEDINIGIGEMREAGKAGEEITTDEYGRAVPDSFFDIFIELGDADARAAIDAFIKAGEMTGEDDDEADESDGSGNVRFGDGESGARPSLTASTQKEIVVVGSKVRKALEDLNVEIRGWDPIKKEVTIGPDNIDDGGDFLDLVGAMVAKDEHIEEVSFNFQKIRIEYEQPAKLFGLLNITMNATVEIDEAEKVNVKFPWYRILAKDNARELRTEMETAMEAHELGHALQQQQTNIDFLRERARVFQTVSNVLRAAHDTAKANL